MAGTRKPKLAQRAAPSAFEIRVQFDPAVDSPITYANHIEVGHTQHEFALLAGRVPAKLSLGVKEQAQTTGELILEPEVQLVLPPSLIPSLIHALQTQLQAWQERFGQPESKEARNVPTKH